MQKTSLNNKGFGILGVLAIIVILCAASGAGAYVYHKNHKKTVVASSAKTTYVKSTPPSPISASAVTQLVKTFYSQYIALESSLPQPQVTQANQLVEQYGSANLINYYTPKPGYSYYANPIMCAQDTPSSVSVSTISTTPTEATATVTETFGSDSVKVTVGIVGQSGSLKIDSVTCNPPLIAQKGGE